MASTSPSRNKRSATLAVIRTGSLREQVTRALEAALVSGELQPGMIYSAPELAERFGVSATPVREAMLDLVKEGFVRALRNRGFQVVEMSDEDLDEIAQIRQLIEVPTIARIAAGISPARVQVLAEIAETIEAAAVRGDVIDYLDSDRRFHVELIATLGNQRLTDLVDRLRRQARLFGLEELASSGQLVASAREHQDLLASLCSGNVEETERMMSAHIRHTRGIWVGREDAEADLGAPREARSGGYG